MKTKLIGLVAGVAIMGLASSAMAVSYASGVVKTGDDVSFVLNQNALSVQVVLDGGAQTLTLPTTAGQLNFNMTGYSSYQIKVASYGGSGWNSYVAHQTSTSFYVPTGVSINRNPASADFGKVFVSNATGGTTGFGRNNPEGIYALNAAGANLYSGTAGITWGGGSGPWRSMVGPDNHLYVTDLSNDLLFDVNPDLSGGVQLIDASNRTANQWVGGVYVEGTQAGGDRKIYLVDVNYNDTARKGLIRYDLGGNAAATTGDTGTQVIGPAYWVDNYYPYDAVRDSAGDWYTSQYRYDPSQAPAITKFQDGTPPLDNNVLWETEQVNPYNGGYCLDINEEAGLVAYGNYYDGWVQIFDMDDGSYVGGFDAGTRMRDIAFDAAGNIVTVDNMTEWAEFWSPGGYWNTLYDSDGTFAIIPEPTTLSLLTLGGLALLLRRRR